MDVRKLRQFLSIVDAGSLSRAAARLNIAQPALSHALQGLETELGVQLLERHARGIALTEFGVLLADQARVILREVDRASELINDRIASPSGEARIAVCSLLSGLLGRPMLSRLRETMPGIRLVLLDRDAEQGRADVISGAVDMALAYSSQPSPEVALRPLVVEDLALALPPGSAIASRRLRLEEIGDRELVLLPRGSPIRQIIDDATARHGLRLQAAGEIGAIEDIFAALQAGFSTILPRSVAERLAERGSGAFAVLDDPRLPCCAYLLTPRNRPLPRPAALAQTLLVEAVEELVQSGAWAGRFVGHLETTATTISIFANQS